LPKARRRLQLVQIANFDPDAKKGRHRFRLELQPAGQGKIKLLATGEEFVFFPAPDHKHVVVQCLTFDGKMERGILVSQRILVLDDQGEIIADFDPRK
jgi:hypothetical protein